MVPILSWREQIAFAKAWWEMKPGHLFPDDPLEQFIVPQRATSWRAFKSWVDRASGRSCFRKQADATWGLHTSLAEPSSVNTRLRPTTTETAGRLRTRR